MAFISVHEQQSSDMQMTSAIRPSCRWIPNHISFR